MNASLRLAFTIVIGASVWASTALAESKHPFLILTQKEAAEWRQRLATEPWAKESFDRISGPDRRRTSIYADVVRFLVMQDGQAGERLKAALDSEKTDPVSQALSFDALHDSLTSEERIAAERRIRKRVLSAMEALRTKTWMNRFNHLPNLSYFYFWDISLLPLALRDAELARQYFEAPMSLKWYLDEYLTPAGFYNEEFSKMFVRAGSQLLWCRGCDRLGISEIGWDYVGREGATWRKHVESVVHITFPRVDLGTDRYHYPRMTMGDAKGARGFPAYGFQHSLVPGALTDGAPGQEGFYGKSHLPQWMWLELAHEKYPEAGFDYFLAQMRAPGAERYIPTPLFGLTPIDPKEVRPPAAKSGVFKGRGIVMLRAEESSRYWEGPWPAVGMRLATPYAHHIQDCFALTGFYAYNRPLFVNRQHSSNYSGVDPGYSNHPRSHSTVLVDNAVPKTPGELPLRHSFKSRLYKFASVHGSEIYAGVRQTRALLLTREYLLDAFHLTSSRPRHYQWIIHTLGHACPSTPEHWIPSQDLVGTICDFSHEHSLITDDAWSITAVQSSGGAHRQFSGFGPQWFTDRIGVKTTVLGEAGTAAYHAWSPVVWDASGHWHGRDRFAYGEDEPAGLAIVALRKKPTTTFLAIHEPFKTCHRIEQVRKITQSDDVFLVEIRGRTAELEPYTDYAMARLGNDGMTDTPLSVGVKGCAFRFRDHGFVRVRENRVDLSDGILGMELTVKGTPKLFRGVEPIPPSEFNQQGEQLVFGEQWRMDAESLHKVETLEQAGPIGARWLKLTALCLPTGGQGTATVRLRNNGLATLNTKVHFDASQGLQVGPSTIALTKFTPGNETNVTVTVDASRAPKNRLLRISLKVGNAGEVQIQPAPLKVAHGVVSERTEFWPADQAETIYSPRYLAKYYYMDSTAAGLLLDPQGHRRFNDAKTSYPNLVRFGTDHRGREGWWASEFPKFPYFIGCLAPGSAGEPVLIYEGGRHAHGTTGGLEQWFTEDWIICRFRNAEPEERIAFDWEPKARKSRGYHILGRRTELAQQIQPGKACVIVPNGQVIELKPKNPAKGDWDWPKEVSAVLAYYHRPAGYDYGSAVFYPVNSLLDRKAKRILQPGDQPCGFTFCTDDEFRPLVEKWTKHPPTGVATDPEKSAYGAAFMPHLERAID